MNNKELNAATALGSTHGASGVCRESPINGLFSGQANLGNLLLSFAIFSTFIPIKIYPIVFLLSVLYIAITCTGFPKSAWVFWMWLYAGYVLAFSWILTFGFQPLANYTPIDSEGLMNIIKLPINFAFLTFSIEWSRRTPARALFRYLNDMLHIVFALTLLQLIVYIVHAGFSSIGFATSSHEAASMYDPSLCFWGMADKNVFGARIALFGFLYLLSYFVEHKKLPVFRSMIVLLCALLSNSRTPMAALFAGIIYILFHKFRIWGRLFLTVAVCVATPFFLFSFIRVQSLLDTSDGMGVRIIYWSTFLTHFTQLSIFGSGLMSAGKFLTRFSPIYLGEPHLHNLFFNTYLDFGLFGCVFYTFFLITFYRYCRSSTTSIIPYYWTAAFLPLILIMLTLSTGYESDTVVYLFAIFAIGRSNSTKLAI